MTIETRADKIEMVGGRVCLDFTNTTSGRGTPAPNERLTSYLELVAWSRHAGILEADRAERLLASAERRPEEAEAALRRALELRETMYRVFSANSLEHSPAEADLALLNEALSGAMSHLRLDRSYDGFVLTWAADEELDQMLWPVIRSAAELLTSEELERVHECGGPDCNWLFLDTTRNRSRKWCDMGDCGNRAKARRHYARRKAGGA